jgi:two-component system sensor histidine kinase MprB
VAAAAVAVAVVLVAVVCYLVVRSQLRGQVDTELQAQAVDVLERGQFALGGGFGDLPPNAGGPAPYNQLVAVDGTIVVSNGGITLPVDAPTLAVAVGQRNSMIEDEMVGSSHLRVIIFHDELQNGEPVAVQLARPLGTVDHVLAQLRLVLAFLCLGGVALAAALGRVAARRVLAPLADVANTADYIGETDDLSRRLTIHADDEVGQLATRFNAMLDHLETSRAAVDESVRAQRQLVADASHELRTPVTSLRTNIEVLLISDRLSDEDRDRLLADVVEQSEELSALVSDLIELARGDEPSGTPEDVRLDRIVEESLGRSRRNSPGIRFEAELAPVLLEGTPERLARAVNNLLDNAAHHSPAGGLVEVSVNDTGVRVRDHGEGVAPEDLPYVFDRFFRGASSRGRQGSGLGLAIVKQVVEQHGGSVAAANAADGGAVFTLWLPVTPVPDGEHDEHATDAFSYAPGGRDSRR